MLRTIKIVFSAAIILSTAFSASATPKSSATHPLRPAMYNLNTDHNFRTQPDSNDPGTTGGGNLGYNQMLLID
jgi:hypothetical protein